MPFSRTLSLFEHWESHPPTAHAAALLLRALTNWEPKTSGPRAPRPDEAPIEGVDYGQSARGFDLLPLSVQAFVESTRTPTEHAA